MALKKVEIKAIVANKDSSEGNYTLYLLEKGSSVVIPIEIDNIAAQILTFAQQKIPLIRPTIHEAMGRALDSLGSKVKFVSIWGFTDGIFFASMQISNIGNTYNVDLRLSDIVALAVHLNLPILMDDKLIEMFGIKLTADVLSTDQEVTEDI